MKRAAWRSVKAAAMIVGLACGVETLRATEMPRQGPPNQNEQPAKVWNTYIEAAGDAIKADDLVIAEVFLQAAVDLARQTGETLQEYLAGTMLYLNYQDQRNVKKAEDVAKHIPQVSQAKFGKEFLPAATVLEAMANRRYEVWQEERDDKKARAEFTLETAAEYERLALAIREPNLGKDDRELSATEGFYGLILSKEKNAADFGDKVEGLYQSAWKRYEEAEIAAEKMDKNSREFSLVQTNENEAPREADDELVMRVLLGKNYSNLGDIYADGKKEKEAREAYAKSAKYFAEVVSTLEKERGDHAQTAYQRYSLATVLNKESDLEKNAKNTAEEQKDREKAIREMRSVVSFYERNRELYSGWLTASAERLATFLDEDGQKTEAEAVRKKYHLKTPNQ
jgi:hypothetical protein